MNTETSGIGDATDKEMDIFVGLIAAISLVHGNVRRQGWWTDLKTGGPLVRNKGEMLALMHSELSECLEGVRKGLMDNHLPKHTMEAAEMADLFIRMVDYCGGFGVDLPLAVIEKMRYNANRPDHILANRQKKGGKKF